MFLPKGSRYIACVQVMMRFYFLDSGLCPWPLLKCIIGRARIVWGAGSMKRYGVRLSVCPSMDAQQRTRSCRFAAVGPAGRRYRSIAAASACGGRMRAVPRCQRTYAAEH